MRTRHLATLLLLCNGSQTPPVAAASAAVRAVPSGNGPRFHKLAKLFVTGNFDGDSRQDTIYQSVFSGITKREIDRSPDPARNDWDTVVKWFYKQRADVVLTLNKNSQSRLHLGVGQGLYCLLNVGDNNADGKDEIAFVVDNCDYSQVNSCQLFTLCNGEWTKLLQFSIHEGAFDFATPAMPVRTKINGFLVKRAGQWRYADYEQTLAEEEPGPMKKLVVPPCR